MTQKITYATMDNLKKHQGKRGLLMFSLYTGEEYSANIGDYFWAPPNARFKDRLGRVMRLGVKLPATVKALNPKVKGVGMTKAEYQAFVKYLNAMGVQRFTANDAILFLKQYHTDQEFRRAWA